MQNSSTAALASRQCRELAKSTEHEALPRRVGTSHASPRAISCKDKFWERHPAAKPQQENGALSRKQHTVNVCPTVQLLLCGQRSNGGYSQSKRFSQMFLQDIAVTRCSLCSPLLSGSCDVPKQDSGSHILTCLSNSSKRNPLPQSHPASAARKGGEEGRRRAKLLQEKTFPAARPGEYSPAVMGIVCYAALAYFCLSASSCMNNF